MNIKYVIIGTSAAGMSAAQTLRRLDKNGSILCISDEKESPYNKCLLVDYLAGVKKESDIYTLSSDGAAQKNIALLRGVRVQKINREKKQLICSNGANINYDKLFLGMGTRPIIPFIMQKNMCDGAFTFHTLRDTHKIMQYIKNNHVNHAVIIGAGLSGLECADALIRCGIKVTIIEKNKQIVSRHVDKKGAVYISDRMKKNGILLHLMQSVKSFITKNKRVVAVQLDDNTEIIADIIICAAGSQPNSEIAQKAGLRTINGLVLVDEYMCTNDANIYAVGDLIAIKDKITGAFVPSCTWPDAIQQGIIAGHTMAGKKRKYPGTTPIIHTTFFGISFFAAGAIHNPLSYYQIYSDRKEQSYRTFLLKNNQLKGFLLIGKKVNVALARRYLMTQEKIEYAQLIEYNKG